MRRYGLLALLLLLVLPASAVGHVTEQRAIEIADAWAARDAPAHPNYCAGGNFVFTPDPTIATAVADGWLPWNGVSYEWDYAACRGRYNPALDQPGREADRCAARAHELMHFVIGPEHVGPLDPDHPGATECFHQPQRAVRRRAKRSRAQIARSIRYQRTRARIEARAFMRAAHARR